MAESLSSRHFDIFRSNFLAFDLGRLSLFAFEEILPSLETGFDGASRTREHRDNQLSRIVVTLDRLNFQFSTARLLCRWARFLCLGHLELQPFRIDRLLGLIRSH